MLAATCCAPPTLSGRSLSLSRLPATNAWATSTRRSSRLGGGERPRHAGGGDRLLVVDRRIAERGARLGRIGEREGADAHGPVLVAQDDGRGRLRQLADHVQSALAAGAAEPNPTRAALSWLPAMAMTGMPRRSTSSVSTPSSSSTASVGGTARS